MVGLQNNFFSGSRRLRFLKLIGAMVLAWALLFVVMRSVGQHYGINDDVTLRNLFMGQLGTRPDAHVLFIRQPLAGFLGFLANIWPDMNVYGLFLVFCHFMALVCLIQDGLAFVQRQIQPHTGHPVLAGLFGLLFLALLFIIEIREITFITFTSASSILVLAALLRCCTAIYLLNQGRFLGWHMMVVVVFLWVAFMLRASLTLYQLPLFIACPFYALALKRNQLSGVKTSLSGSPTEHPNIRQQFLGFMKRGVAFCLGLLILIGLIGMTQVLDRNNYQSPPWQTMQAFSRARSTLYDYYILYLPDYEVAQTAYEQIGLTAFDVDMIKAYDLAFVPQLTTQQLDALAELAKAQFDLVHPSTHRLSEAFSHLKNVLLSSNVKPYAILTAVFFALGLLVILIKMLLSSWPVKSISVSAAPQTFFSIIPKYWIFLLFWLMIHLFVLAAYLFIAWRFRLLDRIVFLLLYPLLIVQFLSMVVCLGDDLRKFTDQSRSRRRGLLVAACIGIACSIFAHLWLPGYKTRVVYERHKIAFFDRLNQLFEQDYPDDAVFLTSVFSVNALLPPFSLKWQTASVEERLIPIGGWSAHLPQLHQTMRQKGIDPQKGIQNLLDRPNTFYITYDPKNATAVLNALRRQNPEKKIEVVFLGHYEDEQFQGHLSLLNIYAFRFLPESGSEESRNLASFNCAKINII